MEAKSMLWPHRLEALRKHQTYKPQITNCLVGSHNTRSSINWRCSHLKPVYPYVIYYNIYINSP
jgi:hypothetical protein